MKHSTMKRSSFTHLLPFALATGAILLSSHPAFAAARNWVGSTPLNWNTLNGFDVVLAASNPPTAASGFIKSGSGMMELTGTNTYTGVTTVTAGTLQVGSGGGSPTGSIAGTSVVNVGGGATFVTASNGALNSTATGVTLGNGNGSAIFQNAGFSGATAANNVQKMGALTLRLGTADVLDFAGNAGTFDFSSGAAGDPAFNGFGLAGTSLNVWGFGTASEMSLGGNFQLLFDTALSMQQVADISFSNSDGSQHGATQTPSNGKYQILENSSPVPEASSSIGLGVLLTLGGQGALVLKARKRRTAA